MAQRQQRQQRPTEGSKTQTLTETAADQNLVIKLQAKKKSGGVRWQEDVVDNEHMNKKKSKGKKNIADFSLLFANFPVCCIYHKPKAWNESSSSSCDECHSASPSHSHSADRD